MSDPESAEPRHPKEPGSPGVGSPLSRSRSGPDDRARIERLERHYRELRDLAAGYLRGERASHTLQPTALVHEAWLRVNGENAGSGSDRAHFLASCARAMRQVLIDHARARARFKRGGARLKMTLGDAIEVDGGGELDVIAVHDALSKLQESSERQGRIVEMRFFAGMTVDGVADALGLSPRTVATEWRFAKAWLTRELRNGD